MKKLLIFSLIGLIGCANEHILDDVYFVPAKKAAVALNKTNNTTYGFATVDGANTQSVALAEEANLFNPESRLNELSKKGSSIYIISEIPAHVADYPFEKELSKMFNKNGYWHTTSNISDADMIFVFRGYPYHLPAVSAHYLYSYIMVYDKHFNFLHRTDWYISFGGFGECTEKRWKKFAKHIVRDIKASKKEMPSLQAVDVDLFEEQYINAMEYMDNHQYKKAAKALKDCIKYDPTQWQIYKQLGFCKTEIKDYKGALKALRKYIDYNPFDHDIDATFSELTGAKRQRRLARAQMFSAAMSLGATAIGATANIYAISKNKSGSIPNQSVQTNQAEKQSSKLTKVECSFCHGTKMNPAKERAAFYSYSEETYTSNCSVCGDRSSHYHKSCPSCMGKGYVLKRQ